MLLEASRWPQPQCQVLDVLAGLELNHGGGNHVRGAGKVSGVVRQIRCRPGIKIDCNNVLAGGNFKVKLSLIIRELVRSLDGIRHSFGGKNLHVLLRQGLAVRTEKSSADVAARKGGRLRREFFGIVRCGKVTSGDAGEGLKKE